MQTYVRTYVPMCRVHRCMCSVGVNDWLHPQIVAWMYATLKK